MDTNAFDRQFSDMVWVVTTGLRAGYSVKQVLEVLAENAPEPAASACKRFLEELNHGSDYEQALEQWKNQVPSPYLARMVDIMQTQRKAGGNLATMLEPLSKETRQKTGRDRSFDALIREQAEQLKATLPEHLR